MTNDWILKLAGVFRGLKDIASEGHTANFNGRSDWANYWIATIRELQPSLLKGGYITTALLKEFETCYRDPHYWASLITFTATFGRKPVRDSGTGFGGE
jgi:hypothetical protein